MRHFFKILFIPLALQLASCSYAIIGTGHLKVVDRDCQPIKNESIQVNNIDRGTYLSSGHLTKDVYVTDNKGLIGFDIEKAADKLVIFLPDAKGEKINFWNWYSTTNNNDEILFFFDKSNSTVKTNFKTELLKTSVEQPLVVVYPYQKDKCNNNNAELDKYNVLKRDAEEKAKKAAAEKARIDAIKVVIPKYKIEAYGIIDFSLEPRKNPPADGTHKYITVYTIAEDTNVIKKEQQKLGTSFGIIVTASETAVLHYSSDITYNVIYPSPGLTNPRTGKTTKSRSTNYWSMHSDRAFPTNKEFLWLMQFGNPWQIKSGEWIFQIKYKDSILLEQIFIVE